MMLLMSGWYFVVVLSRVSVANVSLQYVNSINCMVIIVVGAFGGGWLYGCPMMHNMSGLNLALQMASLGREAILRAMSDER